MPFVTSSYLCVPCETEALLLYHGDAALAGRNSDRIFLCWRDVCLFCFPIAQ